MNIALIAAALPDSSILRIDTQLLMELAVQWVNIIILVVVLQRFLYKPLRRFMDGRDTRIREQLESAAAAEARALALELEYSQKLEGVEAERDEILKKARELGVKRSDEIVAEARREAASIYRRSLDELRMEQQSQRDDMKRAIIDISTRMAGRFVRLSLDEQTQAEYVEKAMQSLEESLWYE